MDISRGVKVSLRVCAVCLLSLFGTALRKLAARSRSVRQEAPVLCAGGRSLPVRLRDQGIADLGRSRSATGQGRDRPILQPAIRARPTHRLS